MEIEPYTIVEAVIIVAITMVGMRLLYGYWPWQKPPVETMKQNVEKIFREQPPPFSEADIPQPPSEKKPDEPQTPS